MHFAGLSGAAERPNTITGSALMSKRILAFILMLLTAAAFAGCRWLDPNYQANETYGPIMRSEAADTEEPQTPEPTDEPTPEATEAETPEPTGTAEAGATEGPSAEPTQPAPCDDYSVFADCAFVGNSIFAGLYAYAIITNSTFFSKVGLNVVRIYDTGMTDSSTVPVIDELRTGSYRGILLMFGTNEVAWPSIDAALDKYEELLDDIWQRQPESKLFLTGVPPVCAFVDESTENDIKNENILYFNEKLAEIAERHDGAYFIPVPDFMYDDEGALPEDASAGDGIHFNPTYYRQWADHLCAFVTPVLK